MTKLNVIMLLPSVPTNLLALHANAGGANKLHQN